MQLFCVISFSGPQRRCDVQFWKGGVALLILTLRVFLALPLNVHESTGILSHICCWLRVGKVLRGFANRSWKFHTWQSSFVRARLSAPRSTKLYVSLCLCFFADTASAACPEHPGSLEKISMTFAAVVCIADDPCSVKTA